MFWDKEYKDFSKDEMFMSLSSTLWNPHSICGLKIVPHFLEISIVCGLLGFNFLKAAMGLRTSNHESTKQNSILVCLFGNYSTFKCPSIQGGFLC